MAFCHKDMPSQSWPEFPCSMSSITSTWVGIGLKGEISVLSCGSRHSKSHSLQIENYKVKYLHCNNRDCSKFLSFLWKKKIIYILSVFQIYRPKCLWRQKQVKLIVLPPCSNIECTVHNHITYIQEGHNFVDDLLATGQVSPSLAIYLCKW